MTLSTSETRSRNWACPELTSSPMKVLERGSGVNGAQMQPARAQPHKQGQEASNGKPGIWPVAQPPSSACPAAPWTTFHPLPPSLRNLPSLVCLRSPSGQPSSTTAQLAPLPTPLLGGLLDSSPSPGSALWHPLSPAGENCCQQLNPPLNCIFSQPSSNSQ